MHHCVVEFSNVTGDKSGADAFTPRETLKVVQAATEFGFYSNNKFVETST